MTYILRWVKVIEMSPDPTWAYLWPEVNKRVTRLWSEYFLTQPDEIIFDLKGKNWKTRDFREILQTQTQYPTRLKNVWPKPIAS